MFVSGWKWQSGMKARSPPLPCCPVSCQCPFKKTLIERKLYVYNIHNIHVGFHHSATCNEITKHVYLVFKNDKDANVKQTVCFYHITCLFKSESKLSSCLNAKKFLAPNKRNI